jgi:hypothetical protein
LSSSARAASGEADGERQRGFLGVWGIARYLREARPRCCTDGVIGERRGRAATRPFLATLSATDRTPAELGVAHSAPRSSSLLLAPPAPSAVSRVKYLSCATATLPAAHKGGVRSRCARHRQNSATSPETLQSSAPAAIGRPSRFPPERALSSEMMRTDQAPACWTWARLLMMLPSTYLV